MQPRQGGDRRRDDGRSLRARPGRRLLRVDAVVPFQRGAGRAGRWRWPAAAQWCCGASSLRPDFCRTSAATAPPTPTTSASRCRMCSATPERPDDADNPLRCRVRQRGRARRHRAFRRAVRLHGRRRLRVDRGRDRDRPHTRTPRPARWVRCPTRSRSSTSTPVSRARPGVVGELVNATRPQGVSRATTTTPRPNAQRMAGGVYHSGDLAYRDEAGYAYFAGRLGDWLRVDGENLGTAPDRAGAAAPSGRDRGGGVRGAGSGRRRPGDGRAGAGARRRIRRGQVPRVPGRAA